MSVNINYCVNVYFPTPLQIKVPLTSKVRVIYSFDAKCITLDNCGASNGSS